jgi:CheY-like chemotaxis protein
VVDDEADSRDIIQRILIDHGAQVTTAASAADALRKLQTYAPDVIVSDIGMPGMDGYQLMRRIRAGERDNARLQALALTAFARKEDRQRVIRAGYQAHLAKPFNAPELVIAVRDLLDRSD